MAKNKKPVSKKTDELNYEQTRALSGWITFQRGCSVRLLPLLAQRFLGIRDTLVAEKTVLKSTRERVESNIHALVWLLEQVDYDTEESTPESE